MSICWLFLRQQKLKTSVAKKLFVTHISIYCSSHKYMFVTNVAPSIKQIIRFYNNKIQEALLQQKIVYQTLIYSPFVLSLYNDYFKHEQLYCISASLTFCTFVFYYLLLKRSSILPFLKLLYWMD